MMNLKQYFNFIKHELQKQDQQLIFLMLLEIVLVFIVLVLFLNIIA
jgi:hypothetical protein